MRTLHELYKLVYFYMKEKTQRTEPQQLIVWMCMTRKITSEEHQKLLIDYRSNKPTKKKHPEFYNHPNFSKNDKKQDWWTHIDNTTRRQMRLFISKMIRKNRNAKES